MSAEPRRTPWLLCCAAISHEQVVRRPPLHDVGGKNALQASRRAVNVTNQLVSLHESTTQSTRNAQPAGADQRRDPRRGTGGVCEHGSVRRAHGRYRAGGGREQSPALLLL